MRGRQQRGEPWEPAAKLGTVTESGLFLWKLRQELTFRREAAEQRETRKSLRAPGPGELAEVCSWPWGCHRPQATGLEPRRVVGAYVT